MKIAIVADMEFSRRSDARHDYFFGHNIIILAILMQIVNPVTQAVKAK